MLVPLFHHSETPILHFTPRWTGIEKSGPLGEGKNSFRKNTPITTSHSINITVGRMNFQTLSGLAGLNITGNLKY